MITFLGRKEAELGEQLANVVARQMMIEQSALKPEKVKEGSKDSL